MKRWQQEHQPPRALKKARLDNIALVPASLLPYRARYQAIANRLPQGAVLVIFPASTHAESPMLEAITKLFGANGRQVLSLTADQIQ